MAERRSHQPQQHVKNSQTDQRDDNVIVERIVETERSDAAALQPAEAVFAAGDAAPAERDGVAQRGKGQRQQGEVYPAAAKNDEASDRR